MMPTERSMQLAAQAWCKPETQHLALDAALATAFAEILDGDIKPQEKYAEIAPTAEEEQLAIRLFKVATNAMWYDRDRIHKHWNEVDLRQRNGWYALARFVLSEKWRAT